MDWHKTISNLEKLVPVAIFAGLLADWFRLRLAGRVEERKHLARVISEVLELRFQVRMLQEIPKHFSELLPPEYADQIPKEILHSIDVLKLLPMDGELQMRYKRAVEEVAGFKPFLAFQLRGKERYFDFRTFLSEHLSQSPGSPVIAGRITEVLDREYMPVLKETLLLLAKAHGIRMRLSIFFALRHKPDENTLMSQESLKVIQEQLRQTIAAGGSQAQHKPT